MNVKQMIQSEIQNFYHRYCVHGDEPVTKSELADFTKQLTEILEKMNQ